MGGIGGGAEMNFEADTAREPVETRANVLVQPRVFETLKRAPLTVGVLAPSMRRTPWIANDDGGRAP